MSIETHQKLKNHVTGSTPSFGCWIMSRDPIMTEVLAGAGFDWLAVDMEHAPITLSEAADLIRVGSGSGCPMMVRLPSHDLVLAKQLCDAGASGLIFPDVRTAEQATLLANGVRYPTGVYGSRGVGLARAAGYGRNFEAYFTGWNDAVSVIAQIEHIDAVPCADAIARIDGIDGLFIGPYDMSASMGIAGQLAHPDLLQNVDRVVAAARAAGKRAGFHVVPVDEQGALAMLDRGATFLAYSADVFMVRHCADMFLKTARG